MNLRYHACAAVLTMLAVYATATDTQSFAKRVALAKKIEEQSTTAAYFQNSMYPAIGPDLAAAMRQCMLRKNASTANFTVVADISQDGKFTHIAHAPKTNTARCVAAAMTSFRAPPPPTCDYRATLPIVIEMAVEP